MRARASRADASASRPACTIVSWFALMRSRAAWSVASRRADSVNDIARLRKGLRDPASHHAGPDHGDPFDILGA